MKVDTDSEMTPRVRVVSAAYSLNSGTLEGREAASFASAAHLHAGGDITSGTLDDARLSSGVAHLGVAETITGNWINTANPWDDSEVTNKLTIDGTGSVADGALSAYVAHLNVAEPITANWVNTANPWADNEVSDVLTLGAGSTIDASINVGNADTLDGNDGTYYAKASHFHSTLTAGTGLGGGTYDGTAAATFAVQYGTRRRDGRSGQPDRQDHGWNRSHGGDSLRRSGRRVFSDPRCGRRQRHHRVSRLPRTGPPHG